MHIPRSLGRILLGLVAFALGSDTLSGQTFVNATNSIGQVFSYLSGSYTSSYWTDCIGEVYPGPCSPSSPLVIDYGHAQDARTQWDGIMVFDPNNVFPPVTYPLPLNVPLTMTAGVGIGYACDPANNPPIGSCPNNPLAPPGGAGAPFAIHIDAPGAQITGTMDQCSTWNNSFEVWASPPNTLTLQYATPGTYTVTATSYTCTDDIPLAATELGEIYAQAKITFTVLPQGDTGPCSECESVAGQPVNLSTGDVWVTKTDYSVPGLSGGLSLTRAWNSLWQQSSPPFSAGMFGIGWTSNVEERLGGFSTNQRVKYWRGTGNIWAFEYSSGSPGYPFPIISPPNAHATLSYDSTGTIFTITFADGTKKIFNSSGYLTSMQDRNGNVTTLTYDGSNRITKITAPGAQWITLTYANPSDPNRVTSIQDSVGTVATYSYTNSLLTNATYADGGQLNYAYDTNNNIISVSDDQAKVIETHSYDAYSRGLTSSLGNSADSVSIQYPTAGTTTLNDSMGNTTTYTNSYISGGYFITGIQGPGCDSCGGRNNRTFALDSATGNRLNATDPNGNTVSYTYDGSGNVLTRTDTAGTWTYTYNGFGEVLTAKDPLGNIASNTYDANGNLLTTTTPPPASGQNGSKTSFTYDTKGELLTTTDPLGNVTTLTYYSTGLMNTIKDAQKNATTFAYDARGNRTSAKDALNNTTTFAYDSMNRLTKITYPNNSTTQLAYDKRGRRISVTDQNSKVTTYAYDDADRLTSVKDAANNTTAYVYDTESNLTSITDASNNATTFTYDYLGRVTKTLFPSNLFETYGYDSNGNLTSKTDRNGNSITYTYDQLNRLTKKSYPDSTAVTYSYDNDSRLTQVSDPTGTYQFAFDNMGRLTGTTTSYSFLTGRNFTAGYGYDAASNRTSLTDPEGGATSYAYDTLNRLSTLTPPSAFVSGSFGFSYDALSRRTQMTRPNGVNTNYSYDTVSRLLSVTHVNRRTTLDGASYTVDAAGNRLSRTPLPSGTATNFGYDAIYELLTATQGSTTNESYTYDAVGNRLSALNSSGWTYNTSNELTSRPGVTFTYDNNGNTLTKTDSTGTTTYAWDFENRLTSVTLPGSGGTVTFKYDPFGRRIYKSSSSGTSIFAYDGDNLIEETNSSGSALARYALTRNIDEPLAMLRSGATSYYSTDGLGSVTSLTNSSGANAATYTYDSFGNLTASTGTLINPFRYTARELDTETGLYYYRARYYDPAAGRFLNEDPIGSIGGPNFYTYVLNHSPNAWDPWGLITFAYNVDRRDDGYGGFLDGTFSPETPPVVRYDCKCAEKGKYKLQISVTWDIYITYGTQKQLNHENGHLAIFQNQFESRRAYYESKYEKTYPSKEECDKASWRVRASFLTDLQADARAATGEPQQSHEGLIQQAWEWILRKLGVIGE